VDVKPGNTTEMGDRPHMMCVWVKWAQKNYTNHKLTCAFLVKRIFQLGGTHSHWYYQRFWLFIGKKHGRSFEIRKKGKVKEASIKTRKKKKVQTKLPCQVDSGSKCSRRLTKGSRGGGVNGNQNGGSNQNG